MVRKVGIPGLIRPTAGLTHGARVRLLFSTEGTSMRITKLTGIAAAIITIAPIGISAQSSGARTTQARPAIVRSDVRELPADQQIIQALSRLTFGARPGDAQKVRALGLDNWIDQQLRPDKIDDSALESFVAKYTVLHRDQSSLLQQYAEQQRERRQVRAARADSTRAMNAADSVAMRQELQQQFNLTRQVVTQLQSSRVARAAASERQRSLTRSPGEVGPPCPACLSCS